MNTRAASRLALLTALAAALGALAAPARAQAPRVAEQPAPLEPIAPDASHPGPLKTFPWIHEGLRVSYYGWSSSLPGNAEAVRHDPNGDLVDKATGQRYTTVRTTGTHEHQIEQLSIVRIDGDSVVTSTRMYAYVLDAPPCPPIPGGSVTTDAGGNLGDTWMDPAKLAQLLGTPVAGMTVAHTPIAIGPHTFDGIFVETQGPNGGSVSVAYDVKTGLLLRKSGCSRAAAPTVLAPGQAPRGDMFLTGTELLGVRDVHTPWAAEAVPEWVAKTDTLHYQGISVFHAPGLPELPAGFHDDVAIKRRGVGWARCTAR